MGIRDFLSMLKSYSMSLLKSINHPAPTGTWRKQKRRIMEQVITTKATKDATVKERVEDIYLVVSWREIAHQYFGRTAAWLYQRFRGMDSNGNDGGFSEKEKEQLRGALYDLSRRIKACAETI